MFGSADKVEGTDVLWVMGNTNVFDAYVDSDGGFTVDTSRQEDASVGYTDSGWYKFTFTRSLDTGDDTDYVIEPTKAWTMGWSICTTDTSMVAPADQEGSFQVPQWKEGATSLAGLAAGGLAALALMLSH